MVFGRSKSPEDVVVRVVHAGFTDNTSDITSGSGKYAYAILSTNCNSVYQVLARDPYTFKQKYEKRVNEVLEQKGLVGGGGRDTMSRLLFLNNNEVVLPVDWLSQCRHVPQGMFFDDD